MGEYYMVMVGDVLTMRHQLSLQAWEGCGLRREWTGDMRAEARPVRVPAEEGLAAACFAYVEIMKLDAGSGLETHLAQERLKTYGKPPKLRPI